MIVIINSNCSKTHIKTEIPEAKSKIPAAIFSVFDSLQHVSIGVE